MGDKSIYNDLDLKGNKIKNVSTVNDIVVEAHASRHLPAGADPLTTATAVSLSATTTNTEGDAESFSRSNHTHDILTGVPSQQIPDQTNAEGTSANLAREDHIHNIPSATPVATGNTNTLGTANSFSRSDHIHNTVISRNNFSDNGTVTTTSATDTLLTGTTLTPVAGTYIVIASTHSRNNTNNANNIFSLYKNATQITNSEVTLLRGGGQGNVSLTYSISTLETFNGTDTVDIRWRVSAGTGSVTGRYLTLIRVA
jgi:hypothetical protein